MQQYDVILKELFQDAGSRAVRFLTGYNIVSWSNVELPQVQNLRMDTVGVSDTGADVHVDIQVRNEPRMEKRMLGYKVRHYEITDRDLIQFVVYIGDEPLRMEESLTLHRLDYGYALLDVRTMDGVALLDSPHLGDNTIALLMRLPDRRAAVRRVLRKIDGLGDGQEQQNALWRLLTLCGLRKAEAAVVKEEMQEMSVLERWADNYIILPEVMKGWEKGREEGREEGMHDQAVSFVQGLIQRRFGPLPTQFAERLPVMSVTEIEDLGYRVSMVSNIEELFGT